MKNNLKTLGEFEMSSACMRVSDPCYDKDVWCTGLLDNCVTGTWEGAVLTVDEGFGERVSVLVARHKETGPDFSSVHNLLKGRRGSGWVEQKFQIGVDSGQAGLFDDAHYQDETVFEGLPAPEKSFGSLWYSHCCEITLSEPKAGVLPFGAVSSSGYGDGCYVCYTHDGKSGEVDFACIVFIFD